MDSTFGDSGKAYLGVPSERFIELASGKILGIYKGSSGADSATMFVRFNTDGTLDTSFGTDGEVRALWPADIGTSIAALAEHPDGHLLVGYTNFTLGRFTAEGIADTEWNGSGFSTVPPSLLNGGATLTAVGVQSSGKVIAMGGQGKGGNEERYMFVARFVD